MTEKTTTEQQVRPPIVVVMGHIDHGKSKILETIRKAKMLDKESGGITQHIGAYEVEHQGKHLTFLDTPGHEAFSAMRSRGATVADIAILVIAADEGIKPQTKEALATIQKAGLPFIIAFNKIDKPEANSERVKQELAQEGVLVESYGGKTPAVAVSAQTGENLDELLETILLLAEVEELTADPAASAQGVVIEANRDARRGITATLLVRNGTLRLGDMMVIGNSIEHIKILNNFLLSSIKTAGPSTPVVVAGLKEIPMVGEYFQVFADKKQAQHYLENRADDTVSAGAADLPNHQGKIIFNLILKADVVGSKEALMESLKKLETDLIGINFLRSEVGAINESDVKLALATQLVTIAGFKVGVDSSAKMLAKNNGVHIVAADIIYELIDALKTEMQDMLPPEIIKTPLGTVKILKFFKKDGAKQIVGGRVESGVVQTGAKVTINRRREPIGTGAIAQVRQEQNIVDEMAKGKECGMLIESPTAVEEGDVLEVYKEEVIKRIL